MTNEQKVAEARAFQLGATKAGAGGRRRGGSSRGGPRGSFHTNAPRGPRANSGLDRYSSNRTDVFRSAPGAVPRSSSCGVNNGHVQATVAAAFSQQGKFSPCPPCWQLYPFSY